MEGDALDNLLFDTLEQIARLRSTEACSQETALPLLDQAAELIHDLLEEHSRHMACAVGAISVLEQQIDQLQRMNRKLCRIVTTSVTHGYA